MKRASSLNIFLFTFLMLPLLVSLSFATLNKSKLAKIYIPFIKNQGQVDERVSFYAKTFGGTLFVTKEGKLIYSLPKHESKDKVKLLALEEVLLGAEVKEVKGTKKSITKVNYFIGNDPKKWRKNIPTYEAITLGEVYKGITLTLKAYGKNVEKIFKVKPGADPNKIRLSIKGAKELKVDKESGELIAITELGEVRFTKPVAYQVVDGKKKEVEAGYRLIGKDSYAFVVGEYDKGKELVIDPLLASTFVGGYSSDIGYAVTVNKNTGEIYVAGGSGPGAPAPGGAYTSSNGAADWYVARLSADLSQLLSATFLGGSGSSETAYDIAIDSQNRVIVGGMTKDNDFPGALNSITDNADGVLAILSQDLSQLIGSRYFDNGTSNDNSWDEVIAIAIDSNDNILIAGLRLELTKVSPDLQSVTKTPDSLQTYVLDMIIDPNGRIILVGATSADNLADATAFDTTRVGREGIIAIYAYDSNGVPRKQAATYLGGSGSDSVASVAINSQGDIVVVGTTSSTDLPTPQNANRYSGSHAGGTWDMFVAICSNDLQTLKALTYIGGSGDDISGYVDESVWGADTGISLDSNDNVYIFGRTTSTDYPTTTGAYQRVNRGSGDTAISLFSSDLVQLLASTYLGGSGGEYSYGMVMDTTGNIIVTGYTASGDFPVTTNAYDNSQNGNNDIFVSILTPDLSTAPPVIDSFSANPNPVLPGSQTTFGWNINEPEGQQMTCDIDVDNDGNNEYTINNCTSSSTQAHTYNNVGTYTAKLTVTDANGGTSTKTIQVVVNTPPTINSFSANPSSGNAPLQVTFSWQINDADGDNLTCQVDVDNDGNVETTINNCTNSSNYQHTYQQGGNYTAKLIVSDGKQGVSQTVNVSVNSIPNISSFSANPSSGNAPLQVTFSWQINDADGDSLTCQVDVDNDGNVETTINNCTNSSNYQHTYQQGGSYTAKLIVSDGKGGSVNKTVNVSVNTVPTINSFSASPSKGSVPLQVTFSWQINDADGNTLTCKVDIDNDGNVDYTIQQCTSNSSQKHTYNKTGTYTAKLAVEDGKGGSTSKTIDVQVTNANPVINSFKADPTSGNAPLEVTLSWDIYDADGQTLVCKIDIDNDGKVDYTIQACKNKGSQKHTYQNANTYTVKLIVEDGFGGKAEKTLQVTVTQATTGGGSGGGSGGGCGNLSPTPALLWGLVLLVGMVRRVLRRT